MNFVKKAVISVDNFELFGTLKLEQFSDTSFHILIPHNSGKISEQKLVDRYLYHTRRTRVE